MTVMIAGRPRELACGATVLDAVAAFSPFGAEPVLVLLNGARVDADADEALSEGDELIFYPLLIGG